MAMSLRYSQIEISAPATLTTCRCCQSQKLFCFLPMGLHSPANMFICPADATAPQPAFPLDAKVCLDCGLIQVADQISTGPFEYDLYNASGTATMHMHSAGLDGALARRAKGGLIVEVGSKDGLMLAAAYGMDALTRGISHIANFTTLAHDRGVEIVNASFTPEMAEKIVAERGRASVISISSAFNHIGDLHYFMEGIVRLLSNEGTFVVEVPWAIQILEDNRFDNICHEHISEMSLLSLKKLVNCFGMDVVDVEQIDVLGGSMRVFIQRMSVGTTPTDTVFTMLSEEREAGLTDQQTWVAFAERIDSVRDCLIDMIDQLKREGLSVAGYGAQAKGNTLLTYFGLGSDRIDFLVDQNPLKQGLLCPGTLIPVKPPEAIEEERPDVLLVLALNSLADILDQEKAFAARGGRFLVPLPQPVMI